MSQSKRQSIGRMFNTSGILLLLVGMFLSILSQPVLASDTGPAGKFSGNIIELPTEQTGDDGDETLTPLEVPPIRIPSREQTQPSPSPFSSVPNPTEVQQATAIPQATSLPVSQSTFQPRVTLFVPPVIQAAPVLNLSPICGYVEDTTQLWQVFNPNAFSVNFTWVTDLGETGTGSVGANSFAQFITSSSANSVSLYVDGEFSTSSPTTQPCKTYLRLSYVCTDNGINWYVTNNNDLIDNQVFTWVLDGAITGSGIINAFETVLVTTSSFGAHTLSLTWVYQPEGSRTVSLSTTIESCGSVATPSPTPTFTATPTNTPTFTPTFTATPTDTPTFTPTFTATPTNTPTFTPTFTATPTDTPTFTPTFTATPTDTPTFTPTFTTTPTETPTETPTSTPTPTETPTETATFTPTPSTTVEITATQVTLTNTPTASQTVPPPPPDDPTRTPTRTLPPPPDNRPSVTPSATAEGGVIIPVTGASLLGPQGTITALLIGLGLLFLLLGFYLSSPSGRRNQS